MTLQLFMQAIFPQTSVSIFMKTDQEPKHFANLQPKASFIEVLFTNNPERMQD